MERLSAALGFKLHTGWAAAVAVASGSSGLTILLRRRTELLPANGCIPRFVFHQAAKMPPAESADLVKRAAAASHRAARSAVLEILRELRSYQIQVAGIPSGSTALPGDLASIVKSHALIHAAEGVLFQKAVVAACERNGVHAVCPRERELWTKIGPRMKGQIEALRQSAGPPWGADQKIAAAAALVALESFR